MLDAPTPTISNKIIEFSSITDKETKINIKIIQSNDMLEISARTIPKYPPRYFYIKETEANLLKNNYLATGGNIFGILQILEYHINKKSYKTYEEINCIKLEINVEHPIIKYINFSLLEEKKDKNKEVSELSSYIYGTLVNKIQNLENKNKEYENKFQELIKINEKNETKINDLEKKINKYLTFTKIKKTKQKGEINVNNMQLNYKNMQMNNNFEMNNKMQINNYPIKDNPMNYIQMNQNQNNNEFQMDYMQMNKQINKNQNDDDLEGIDYMQMNNQMNNPMNKQMNNQMNNPMNKQMNNPMNNQMNNPMNKQMNNPMNKQMNNPMNNRMNNPMNNQMNNPMNNQMNNPMYNQMNNPMYNKMNNPMYNKMNNNDL